MEDLRKSIICTSSVVLYDFSFFPSFFPFFSFRMMTIAAWVANEAIPGALPVWHP
jgi:hypothetical protein